MRLLDHLPPRFRHGSHITTRHLHGEGRAGHITCLVQQHPRPRRVTVDAFPPALEHDALHRARIPATIYACSYVLAGSGTVRLPGEAQARQLRAGSLFCFHDQPTLALELRPDPGMIECSLVVDGDTGAHLAASGAWPTGLDACDLGPHPHLVACYLAAYQAIGDPDQEIVSLIRQVLTVLEAIGRCRRQSDPDEAFRREAQRLLGSHHRADQSMGQIAAEMGIPYETFRHRFRRLSGMAPREFQLRARIEQATILLQQTTVADCAAALGYSDPFVFSRQFRKRMGIPPGQYRRSFG